MARGRHDRVRLPRLTPTGEPRSGGAPLPQPKGNIMQHQSDILKDLDATTHRLISWNEKAIEATNAAEPKGNIMRAALVPGLMVLAILVLAIIVAVPGFL